MSFQLLLLKLYGGEQKQEQTNRNVGGTAKSLCNYDTST